MIKPYCYKCKLELIRLGAILISPPNDISAGDKHEYFDSVFKFHLCLECFNKVYNFINIFEENKDIMGYKVIGT